MASGRSLLLDVHVEKSVRRWVVGGGVGRARKGCPTPLEHVGGRIPLVPKKLQWENVYCYAWGAELEEIHKNLGGDSPATKETTLETRVWVFVRLPAVKRQKKSVKPVQNKDGAMGGD